MAPESPIKFSRAVRETLHWVLPDDAVQRPHEARGETRHLLHHAERLHESLRCLPAARQNGRCLVVGSCGIEVPYLSGKLGWQDVTCVTAPRNRPGEIQRCVRSHPSGDEEFPYTLIEHDIEAASLPLEGGQFDLVVYWGCIEMLRHDPEFSLYELNRVCADGATISLVTENAISFQATHSMLRGQPMPMRLHWPPAEGHWRRYTPREIGELLVGTGWLVEVLTSIVHETPLDQGWWRRWRFKRAIRRLRYGFGLAEPYWNAFVLAQARKVSEPTRAYPQWLYKDEKIRQLKVEMLELVTHQTALAQSA